MASSSLVLDDTLMIIYPWLKTQTKLSNLIRLAMNRLPSQFFTFESHDFQRNKVNPMNRNHFQFNSKGFL